MSIGEASETRSKHRETFTTESDVGGENTVHACRQRATPDPDDLTDAGAASIRMIRGPGTRRGSAAAHQPQLRAPSGSTCHPISCFIFQVARALCLMRTRPAVMPTPTVLLASSAPCMPQVPTALSAPSSPGLSSALFGWGRDRPCRTRPPSHLLSTAGAASSQ